MKEINAKNKSSEESQIQLIVRMLQQTQISSSRRAEEAADGSQTSLSQIPFRAGLGVVYPPGENTLIHTEANREHGHKKTSVQTGMWRLRHHCRQTTENFYFESRNEGQKANRKQFLLLLESLRSVRVVEK